MSGGLFSTQGPSLFSGRLSCLLSLIVSLDLIDFPFCHPPNQEWKFSSSFGWIIRPERRASSKDPWFVVYFYFQYKKILFSLIIPPGKSWIRSLFGARTSAVYLDVLFNLFLNGRKFWSINIHVGELLVHSSFYFRHRFEVVGRFFFTLHQS